MAKRVKDLAKNQCIEQCTTVIKDEDKFDQQINPLFVEVILENILSHLKDTNQSTTLKEYRLVCKFWNKEIVKMIRRETHIKLHRILTPYPEGFGWIAVGRGNKFQYKVPYQQETSFPNVEIVIQNWVNSDGCADKKFEKWFKVMGHEVKSLIYFCSLQTEQIKHFTILERILKEWCPNLERLTLKNVEKGCLKGLIFTSLFEDPKKEMVCKKLTELNLNMNLDDFTWQESDNVPNILTDPVNFNEFIYNHGLPGNNHQFPEISNHVGVKVSAPLEISTNAELPDLSKSIPGNFFPEHLDGGILGQLMKYTNVKKLTLGGKIGSTNRNKLMAFFHYRQNNWRTSLKHLEINWNVPFENFTKDLVLLGKLKFPIVTLKLTTEEQLLGTVSGDLTRYLSSFSDTLECLDINMCKHVKSSEIVLIDCEIVLPLLPRLKTFTINRIDICKLSAANLIQNAPNLVKCYLTDNGFYGGKNLDTFFQESPMLINKQLTDLWLIGEDIHFSGQQASKLLDWFPKVKRLELIGIMEENIGMTDFLRKLEKTEVTDLNLSWCKTRESALRSTIAGDTALIQEIGKLQKLVSLEMRYDHEILPIDVIPFHVMPIAFREGFGNLSNLRYLKLSNFGIYLREKPEVMKCIEHIPVVHLFHMDYICPTSRQRKNEMIAKVIDFMQTYKRN